MVNRKNLLTLKDFSDKECMDVIEKAMDIKQNPGTYNTVLKDKTLLMIFQKPSLRTRISFEVGMTQLGGHAIYYDVANSPMGKKESISDTAKTASRYVDIIMARLFDHKDIEELAENASIPVINALTNFSHPCQILGDLLTIMEKKGKLSGLKLAYVGDSNNNVTHSLMYGCSKVGVNVVIGCPAGEEFEPQKIVVEECRKYASQNGSTIEVFNSAQEAVKDADVVYTDSWMSYHIPEDQKEERLKIFEPFQVNKELMGCAKEDAIFMNCLPAIRGYEQTAEVIDGSQSVVFDEAENRLHIQKAIILYLLGK